MKILVLTKVKCRAQAGRVGAKILLVRLRFLQRLQQWKPRVGNELKSLCREVIVHDDLAFYDSAV